MDYHIKRNKSDRYMISCRILKNDTNELTDQTEVDSQTYKTYGYQRGRRDK